MERGSTERFKDVHGITFESMLSRFNQMIIQISNPFDGRSHEGLGER
jgi:hypothetical protein